MMRKIILILIIVLNTAAVAQVSNTFGIETGDGTVYIPVYERQGLRYISVKHLADALRINNFVSAETGKVELKFGTHSVKFTPKNPYVVIELKTEGKTEVVQLPTSTYQFDGNLFVPLEYTMPLIKKYSGIDVGVSKSLLSVKTKPPEVQQTAESSGMFDVTGLSIDQKANGMLIKILCNKKIGSYSSNYNSGYVSVVLKNVKVDESVKNTPLSGLIKQIEVKNEPAYAEIRFKVTDEYSSSEIINSDGNNLLLTIHNKIFVRSENRNSHKEKWGMDVVVIDAGHGGKDAGAIGVNGAREKDINLAIAKKLGQLIESSMKDVKVVYTRTGDYFVELYKRGKIANENNGKLFISIHCNSAKKKPSEANGFEVYLLRPGRTSEAISIAERENSVIEYEENPDRYQQLTDENFILVSMAHSAYMKYSEKFSDLLNGYFSNSKSLATRGVKQAGFYVLVGASMPGVLVETGFLSNKKDAAYLASKNGQQEIAENIFKAVKDYKLHYERVMEAEL